jgi:RND family efflux transporter MFP subunit
VERKKAIAAIGVVAVVVLAGVIGLRGKKAVVAVAAKPALTVLVVRPEEKVWAERITASGGIQPWQETIVGAELGGLRLAEVLVNVGDRVRKGDLLARFADEIKLAELSQQQASYDEAGAHFAEASANAQRALKIRDSGAMSEQELQQLATAADMARAQMQLAGARLDAEKLRYRYTRVTAPDDGLISSRTATVGAVVQSGAELFRMIRRGRLEWHADLPADAIQRVRIGQKVLVMLSGGEKISAVVARISPVIDAQSRNGKVYVELPANSTLRAGMFVQGEFDLGQTHALTVPQSAVVIRDGYAYLYQPGNENHVAQIKVSTGRRVKDRVEITGGIKRDSAVVASGAGFLNDGDLVRIAPAEVAPR